MPSQLPPDPVMFEQTIRAKLYDLFMEVPIIVSLVRVHKRERFPDNRDEDIALSTVPDPVNSEMLLTSIIQIGLPTVEELEYTGDTCTQLNFTYPITFDLDVKDLWDDTGLSVPLEFKNSSDLAMAVYMRARNHFKFNRTLGFDNCVHDYLQQDTADVSVPDEESGGRAHVFDWSLTVKCTSAVV